MAHQAILTWAAPDDASLTATYNVYRASGLCPASGLGSLAFSKIANTSALTYTDANVKVGGQYCYYGTHVEGTVESVPGNTAGGTVTPHGITIQLVVS